MPGAGAGDSIAGTDVSDTLSYGDHGSGAAITGGTRLIHAAADRGQGGRHAITANFVPDLPHQVGTHSGFLQQILPGELSRSPLGPNRNQRCGSAYQYATRKQFRSGYIDHFDLAAADLLEKLFHIVSREYRLAVQPLKTYSIRNCTMVSRSLSRFGSG